MLSSRNIQHSRVVVYVFNRFLTIIWGIDPRPLFINNTITTDYVKLMDLDLFELMIKMLLITPTQTLKSPPLEIEVKNSVS